MELQAAIEALNDSRNLAKSSSTRTPEYVKNGVSAWLSNWKRNGWRTKSKKPVKNGDLWRALDSLVSKHKIEWHWLKGHAGHIGNERCDQLANEEIAKIKKTFSAEQLKELLAQFSAKDAADQKSEELFER